ncbi:hypothetical protein [Deinococcus rubellus]|uniref:Uncharacterized protein n=1 Tax=Deinococcus rubellus TaxID=1889240 RepID=A0ABY5YE53_9DEIO|nr:hypothetical protein [Deinococcus rubellus]UWX63303.1 hypothetical protein N0D28_11155 [Deinococcus rubellus]
MSRQARIRFENWKPEKKRAEVLRAEISEEIALVMEGIEPEDYLSECRMTRSPRFRHQPG